MRPLKAINSTATPDGIVRFLIGTLKNLRK
jgi:hypothetical protein